MPTEDQYISAMRAAGDGVAAMSKVTKKVTFTVSGNTTLSATVDMPAGSIFRDLQLETPAAVAGTPTTCNFSAGTAAAGAQIVAAVDAKAQGHIACTIVTAFDKVGNASAAKVTVYLQLVTAGGTAATGTVYALVGYDAPVF